MRSLPSDAKASEMYDLYLSGLSLADVAAHFGCTRQSVYGLFKTRSWPMRTVQLLPRISYGGRVYTMRNTGYYGCTTGDRHLLHRRVWEDANGPIPDGWDIHHRDENKTNNALDNFECLPKAEHTRMYSPHCNQFVHRCAGSHD